MVAQSMLSVILRLIKRNVVIWNILHSLRNRPLGERIRLIWWRMFDAFFLYTDREVDELRAKGFKKAILIAANNGLDQDRIDLERQKWPLELLKRWQTDGRLSERQVLLSTGRLIERNRYCEMVAAMAAIVREHPNVLWCVIGNGPAETSLRAMVATEGLNEHVYFGGGIHDEEKLAPWFLSASVFVHPGPIGLSLLHAFGYGLPVVTHRHVSEQGPEFDVFIEGQTGRTFAKGNVADLARVVTKLLHDAEDRQSMSGIVTEIARHKHNTRIMAQRFSDLIEAVTNRRRSGHQRAGMVTD